jgi:hypothetical protein
MKLQMGVVALRRGSHKAVLDRSPQRATDITSAVRNTGFAAARHCNAGPGRLEGIHELRMFRDDDRGYTAWLTENARGYVLNIQRVGSHAT